MYELIGILVGLNLITCCVSLLMIDLLIRSYCLIKEKNYDIRKILER